MSWRIVMIQGGGCDYTIGCGVKFENLSATTLEEAIKEAKEFFLSENGRQYLNPMSASHLEEAYLIQANDNPLPIKNWEAEAKVLKEKAKRKRQEEKELVELDRLQKKYGK